MLLPEQVRPFLVHEDDAIRKHALSYLAEAHDPSPATAEDVWAGADRSSGELRISFLARLSRFPVTERSTARLFEALRSERDPEIAFHLHRALLHLPPEALRRALDDASLAAVLHPETRQDAEAQIALAGEGFEQLWKALADLAAASADVHTIQPGVIAPSLRIVRTLARFPEEAAARAVEILRGGRAADSAQGWMEIFALELFGLVPYPGPLDPLLAIVGDEEGDYANDRAVDALVRLGTPEVVQAVAARFASSGEVFRLYAPSVLGRIKRRESEAALMRLLSREDGIDLYVRTSMAMALCDLCTTSPDALDRIRRMVETGAYDGMLVDLDELLLTAGAMVGWEPPGGMAAWRARVAAQAEAKRAERRDMAARFAASRSAPAAAPPKRRGFVPYGKKARRKKGGKM